jgi:hypothetical protein
LEAKAKLPPQAQLSSFLKKEHGWRVLLYLRSLASWPSRHQQRFFIAIL